MEYLVDMALNQTYHCGINLSMNKLLAFIYLERQKFDRTTKGCENDEISCVKFPLNQQLCKNFSKSLKGIGIDAGYVFHLGALYI